MYDLEHPSLIQIWTLLHKTVSRLSNKNLITEYQKVVLTWLQ
jgi:hypothetical protein